MLECAKLHAPINHVFFLSFWSAEEPIIGVDREPVPGKIWSIARQAQKWRLLLEVIVEHSTISNGDFLLWKWHTYWRTHVRLWFAKIIFKKLSWILTFYFSPMHPRLSLSDETACRKELERGPCRANIRRFYYNLDAKRCEQFSYGGCQGNENNFETLASCRYHCEREAQPTGGKPPRNAFGTVIHCTFFCVCVTLTESFLDGKMN